MPTIKNLQTGNYKGSRKAYIMALLKKQQTKRKPVRQHGRGRR